MFIFGRIRKRKLTEAEILAFAAKLYTKIMLRSTVQGLSRLTNYYSHVKKMTETELLSEKHEPKRLGQHIRYVTGAKRPKNVAAHAIISGDHEHAEAAREILAKWGVGIDDPVNGVFLPRDSRFMPHPKMPDACNHAELHTHRYYVNVTRLLRQTTSARSCRVALRLIATDLQNGEFEY